MDRNFLHRWVPGAGPDTLLLLHGTGGNEDSLLGLGRSLLPGANLLSPRGQVLEGGALPRFFRRVAEGVFDLDDLVMRAEGLGAFVAASSERYGFDPARVTAVGFSNGANIAASLLLLHPEVLSRAVLFRAMVPLEPDPPRPIRGTPVFLGAGRHDPIVPPDNIERLAALLRDRGAQVTLEWQQTGHQLLAEEVDLAASWLGK